MRPKLAKSQYCYHILVLEASGFNRTASEMKPLCHIKLFLITLPFIECSRIHGIYITVYAAKAQFETTQSQTVLRITASTLQGLRISDIQRLATITSILHIKCYEPRKLFESIKATTFYTTTVNHIYGSFMHSPTHYRAFNSNGLLWPLRSFLLPSLDHKPKNPSKQGRGESAQHRLLFVKRHDETPVENLPVSIAQVIEGAIEPVGIHKGGPSRSELVKEEVIILGVLNHLCLKLRVPS